MEVNENEKKVHRGKALWLIPVAVVLAGTVFWVRNWRNRHRD